MYYEINVSLNGTHFFATADRSLTNMAKLKEVAGVFSKKFPQSEGYEISIKRVECVGYQMDIADLK